MRMRWLKRHAQALLSAISGGLLAFDFLSPPANHFAGFYALCGVVICVILCVASSGLQKLASREAGYYDE